MDKQREMEIIGSSSQASKKTKCRKRNINDDANKTKVSQESSIPTVECMRNVSSLIDQVRIRIETCMLSYLTKEQVVKKLENEVKIDPGITLEVWARLEAENAQFFSAYYARLELIQQINTFNTLLERQHQLMKKLQGQVKFNIQAADQQQQKIMQMQMQIPNANYQPCYHNINPMTMIHQSPSIPPMNNQVIINHMGYYNQYSGNQQSMAMSNQKEQGQSSTKRARLDAGQSSQAVQPKMINEEHKQKQVVQNPSDISSLAEIPKSFSFEDLTELLNSLDSNMEW